MTLNQTSFGTSVALRDVRRLGLATAVLSAVLLSGCMVVPAQQYADYGYREPRPVVVQGGSMQGRAMPAPHAIPVAPPMLPPGTVYGPQYGGSVQTMPPVIVPAAPPAMAPYPYPGYGSAPIPPARVYRVRPSR